MFRIIEDLIDHTFLNDFSGIHDIDVICHFGNHAEVMCDVNNGNASLFLYPADQLDDFCLNRNIQCSRRLITDQKIRVAGKRDGNDHTLSHTTGELVRIVFHTFFRILDTNLF